MSAPHKPRPHSSLRLHCCAQARIAQTLKIVPSSCHCFGNRIEDSRGEGLHNAHVQDLDTHVGAVVLAKGSQEFFFERSSFRSFSMVLGWRTTSSSCFSSEPSSDAVTSSRPSNCSSTNLITSGVSFEGPFGPGFFQNNPAVPSRSNRSLKL